jgi:LemA protein
MTSKAKTDPGHKEGLILVGALSLILIVAIDWAASINHQLVAQEQGINEKWAQVLNICQRRADLVPALVEKVKRGAIQEQAVAEDVTTARTRALGIRTRHEVINDRTAMQSFQQSQQELGGALSRLLATAAHYPDLMSNQSFLALEAQLEDTENSIAVARMRYNEAVGDYNARLTLFPGSLVASFRGSKEKADFEAATRKNPPTAKP